MKPLSEVAPGLLVIQIQIQAVHCRSLSFAASETSWASHVEMDFERFFYGKSD